MAIIAVRRASGFQPGTGTATLASFAAGTHGEGLPGAAPCHFVQPGVGCDKPLMRHQSILGYAGFRWLKIAGALVALAIAAYIWHRPPAGPGGGTWLGYTLGTIAALLILWLTWFGVRKRRYRADAGLLLGWLSAHIYLGASLIVLATLHAAFQVGWNVHTLAYALMLGVIVSGFYGVYAYFRYPKAMTENLGEDTQETLLLKIGDFDRESRQLALGLPDGVNRLVLAATQDTRIGGSWRRQLSGRDPDCATAAAINGLQAIGRTLRGEQARTNQQLYAVLLRKQELLTRARRDVAMKARLDLWLYFHVPLTIALLAALITHVISVFFYW